MPPVKIAAVVVTYQREVELVRLLKSIEESTLRPSLVVVVDHAAAASTEELLAQRDLPIVYVASPENPGPGAGWRKGMEIALTKNPETTHFLVLDDDVVLPSDAISKLVAASAKAAMVCPMLLDSEAQIWGFPEPKESKLRKQIRQIHTATESIAVFGTRPLPFVWCTGACVLVRRDAVDAVGFHRTDFWMLGEDLEYSMRVAAFGGGLFLPDVFVPHLPPASQNPDLAAIANLKKFKSLLQNLAYLSFHHPNSRHLRFYLPGNTRRYFRTFGWKISSLSGALSCLWKGAILGRPSGFDARRK